MADYPDFEGPKRGVYDPFSWGAVEGVDKNFTAFATNKGYQGKAENAYVVPAGKTLYIKQFSFQANGSAAADRDKQQACVGGIYSSDLGDYKWWQGANCGGGFPFTTPLVFEAGDTVTFLCYNYSNHNCDLGVAAGGIEL